MCIGAIHPFLCGCAAACEELGATGKAPASANLRTTTRIALSGSRWLYMPEDWTERVLHDTWVREDGAVNDTLLVIDPDEQISREMDTGWIA